VERKEADTDRQNDRQAMAQWGLPRRLEKRIQAVKKEVEVLEEEQSTETTSSAKKQPEFSKPRIGGIPINPVCRPV
jgi:hypothetical protein